MTTDNEKKLFEEYRMELIYLGDVITTSDGQDGSQQGGTDSQPQGPGGPYGDEGWGEDPSFE